MSGAVVFFTVFTLVYGAMGWLVYRLAAAALAPQGVWRLGLTVWFVGMTLAPVLGGMLGHRTGVWAGITYVWLGFIFYMFMFGLMLAVLKPFFSIQGFRFAFVLASAAAVAVCGWGWYNARTIVLREVVLPAPSLPAETPEVRIAALSDVHLYSVEAEDRVERILAALAPVQYDMLVSLGDFVEADVHRAEWQPLAARFASLRPRLGKYAIRGNHEAYADLASQSDIAERFLQAGGFVVLNDLALDIQDTLRLVGFDHVGYLPVNGSTRADLLPAAGSQHPRPVVVLKHMPDLEPGSLGRFDLQLSGHTHAGQLWPFYYLAKMRFPYVWGLYDLGQGRRLYTAPGTSVWGPPLRVGSPSEITLIRLVRNVAAD